METAVRYIGCRNSCAVSKGFSAGRDYMNVPDLYNCPDWAEGST